MSQNSRITPLLPTALLRWRQGLLALSLIAAPTVLSAAAQEPAAVGPAEGRTHVVKKGDTLWDIARAYLNDPFQWPEIYRLNTAVVEDPHWIYPGEVLELPEGAAGGGGIVAELPEPAAGGDAEPVAAVRSVGPTIFSRAVLASAQVSARAAPPVQPARTAVRAGEFYAAPWIDRVKGPASQGRLIGTAEPAGIAEASERVRIQAHERVYVTLPGAAAAVGTRYITLALGPEVGSDGQVLIPTGIVEVERVDGGGVATVSVIQQFDEIKTGQGVIAFEQFSMPEDVRPAQVSDGAVTRVVWVPSRAILPSLQHYVLLQASSTSGVKIGDQFTLFRPRVRTDDGVFLPEEKLALVQIVKVTQRGSTALIVDHKEPAIKEGTAARLTARMP
ncbi:MAG: LysM peptidoglycan-binding domain-containing protein [Gemmatimonadaceae bacterium]